MDLALITLKQIIGLLLLMGLGVLCSKLKIIDEETNKRLSSIILLIVNPLIIFMSYQRSFEAALLKGLLLSLGLGAISFFVGMAITHLVYRNKGDKNYAIEQYACIYSNSGFIGLPLVNGIFGMDGVFYMTAYLTVFNLLMWTHGVMIMSNSRSLNTIKKALVAPGFIAVILGFFAFYFQIHFPEIIANPLRQVANMNTPLGMLIAGVSLTQADLKSLFKKADIWKLSIFRLIVLPVVIFFILSRLSQNPVVLGTVILGVCSPCAANIVPFAYRYNKDHIRATEFFIATTMISMVTIPLLMFMFHV